MNFRISEKEVLYRINNKNKKNKTIGEYIRKERLSQGLKQEVVCKNICSVSYYSRIESNKVIPSDLYIKKIFNKLNKPVPKIFNHDYNQEVKNIISNFLAAIDYKNDNNVEEEFKKLKEIPEVNYDLYNFIYSIYFEEIDHLKPLVVKLHQQQIHFDNEELLLYLEYLGTYYALINEINEAEQYLSMALNLQKNMGITKPSILYRYAWILGKMNNNYQCINYAEEADKKYTENNNTYRSIQCKMLICIKLSEFFPQRAAQLYEECIKIIKHSNYKDLSKIVKFNLALVYKKCKDYINSEKLLKELITEFDNDNSNLFYVYVELVDLYILSGKHKNAIKYYNILSTYTTKNNCGWFYLKYFDYKLNKHDIANTIQVYNETFIPYFKGINNKDMLINSRLELAKLYYENNQLNFCIDEYKKIINLLLDKKELR